MIAFVSLISRIERRRGSKERGSGKNDVMRKVMVGELVRLYLIAMMRLAVLLWTLLVVTASARGADLCSFQYHGKVLSFVVSNCEPVTATVDDSAAVNLAVKWAVGFYAVEEANVDGIELRAVPARFWLVRLFVSRGKERETVYGVVLLDGSVIEPTIRDLL
jgi:hypothetical protein